MEALWLPFFYVYFYVKVCYNMKKIMYIVVIYF